LIAGAGPFTRIAPGSAIQEHQQPKGDLIVKALFSVSTLAVALMLGTSGAMFTPTTAGAQSAKAKPTAESRMKMCQDRTKGIYRSQQDGFVHVYGYCLSNVQPHMWTPQVAYR
jgi:hypothetical protein